MNGDLICRKGNGFFSGYFSKYASRNQKYSHIGIITIENDSIYVFHSEASELTGVGKVQKENLYSFLDGIDVYQFYRIDSSVINVKKALEKVNYYYQKETPFDLSFNSFDDSELYCTELVAMSLNLNSDSCVINPSLELNNRLLFTIDDIIDKPYVFLLDLN